jgi:predicted amidophosphoribosyltransferase
MSPTLATLLLLAGLVCWYVQRVQAGEPIVRRCSCCGDLVSFLPGLPTRCPTCGRYTLI